MPHPTPPSAHQITEATSTLEQVKDDLHWDVHRLGGLPFQSAEPADYRSAAAP
ncbi:hypothetical protein [Streptomyces niveus]|uniref:hypothetical protein n=1 Tax=Streptomyces niveus TaxID=193462 RepID=UPI00344EBE9A